MKIVAISQRVDVLPERNETRDALDQRLVALMLSLNYLTLPIPNVLAHSVADWLAETKPDALVLSGGNNIGENFDRDSTERVMLEYAKCHELPTLGICRGLQMMANWAGVELHHTEGHVKTRHSVSGLINREVNSFHTYSIKDCPLGFEVIACSEDGLIEAIRHKSWPWEGWMWHPEREEDFIEEDTNRIRSLF